MTPITTRLWPTALNRAIGRSRYVVLLAVIAAMLVAASLFVLGAMRALVAGVPRVG